MTSLQRLYDEQGHSLWLDNLNRPLLRDGTLARLVADGVRGVTANPTIFAKAIRGSDAYDE
jgi:transaldolase